MIPLSGTPSEVAQRDATLRRLHPHEQSLVRIEEHYDACRARCKRRRSGRTTTPSTSSLRAAWPIVPFKEEIRWLSERDGLIVGDFGCGEAFIAAETSGQHEVYSFDHVAINDDVMACDMTRVPLEDRQLDVAIFCLSLMGTNFTEYIREAHRCLRLDGCLHIWEPANYFPDVDGFADGLARLGFDVAQPVPEGDFVRIYATKNSHKPDAGAVLPFRGVRTA